MTNKGIDNLTNKQVAQLDKLFKGLHVPYKERQIMIMEIDLCIKDGCLYCKGENEPCDCYCHNLN